MNAAPEVLAAIADLNTKVDRLIGLFERDELLDEPTVARMRGKSRSALQKERAQGRGPAYQRDGRLIRYRRSVIEAWMNDHEEGGRKNDEPYFANVPRNRRATNPTVSMASGSEE